MTVTIQKGVAELLGEAAATVDEVSVAEVETLRTEPGVALIDIRDRPELENSGTIPGAHHASRGMLEFMADPKSPYHKEIFSSADRLILYCGTSARSALAAQTLMNMGFTNVSHMTGGIKAWIGADGALEPFKPDAS